MRSSIGFGIGGPRCQPEARADEASQPAAGGGLTGGLGGALGGLMNRRRERAAETQPAAASATLPSGVVPLLTVTSEVLSVSQGAIDPQSFEVPADFRRTGDE